MAEESTSGSPEASEKPAHSFYGPPPLSPEPLSPETIKQMEFRLSEMAFDEAVSKLGKISIEFQYLETDLKVATGFLINKGDDWIGKIVTSGMHFGPLLDLLYSLFEWGTEIEGSTFNKFKAIVGRCRNCAAERNSLVHSLWYHDIHHPAEAKALVFTRSRSKIKVETKLISRADLEALATKIENCRKDLNAFFESIYPDYEQFSNL
jgi:hypothetical protein